MSETSSKPKPPKPPKPQKRNAQASRRRLIDAAIDVFSRNGPKGATIDEICDNGCDDDFNGDVDCDDEACAEFPACIPG